MKKDVFRKISAFTAAAIMLTASVSCGNKGSSSEGDGKSDGNMVAYDMDISAGDMPDGSSTVLMSEGVSGVPLKLEYIPEYLSEDEGIVISRYFYSISAHDGDMMKSCFYEGSMNYIISEGVVENSQNYVDKLYEQYSQFAGGDFEFSYLIQDSTDTSIDFSDYDNMVKDHTPDAVIEDKKMVLMDVYFNAPDLNISSTPMKTRMGDFVYIVLYKIDGQYYVMG